jgi:hypothetical protein
MEAVPLRAGRAQCVSNMQRDMVEQTLEETAAQIWLSLVTDIATRREVGEEGAWQSRVSRSGDPRQRAMDAMQVVSHALYGGKQRKKTAHTLALALIEKEQETLNRR